MWNNIGPKVQRLAKFICWIGIIASVLAGIIMLINGISSSNTTFIVTGIVYALLGPLFSWIGSWITYAIGEAAEAAERTKL